MFYIEGNRVFLENESGEMLAEVTFPQTEEGKYTINRTYVDERLRGQGMASRLVQAAVEEIEKRGGTVTATCSYAKKWLEKNSE